MNKLTLYTILCRKVAIFYRQKLASGKRAGIQNETFRVAVSLQMTAM